MERRHQILRKALSIFMTEKQLRSLDGLHRALNWTVPSLNQCTFVNGYTPMQLALGKQPNMPGLISDERTGPVQLQQAEQVDYDGVLNLKPVPNMPALWLRLTSNFDVLFSDAFQVLMKICSQANDACIGEKLATASTRFSGKALQRSYLPTRPRHWHH